MVPGWHGSEVRTSYPASFAALASPLQSATTLLFTSYSPSRPQSVTAQPDSSPESAPSMV